MHVHDAFSLMLFALGAFLIPLGAGRVGVPSAVGEIVYGILVGPQVLGLMQSSPLSTFLAEFGFVFLMFLAGLEVDFSRIERESQSKLAVGGLTAAAILGTGFVVMLALGLPVFLFLVFSAMSVGVMLVTLAEAELTKTPAGQGMIFVGSVGEALTIVAVTGLTYYYKYGLGLKMLVEVAKLGVIFIAAYGLLVVLRTLIWWHPRSFSRLVRAHDPSEVGVRAGMALMLVFVAFAALMGVEPILGAFVAGALSSFVFREKGVLETKLSSIGFGFFVPIFFIWVGTEFDISAAASGPAWLKFAVFFGASLAAKLLPALLLLLRGFSLREAIGAGLLLAAPLTLLVAIARIGLDLKVVDRATASAVVLLAIVTGLVLPWVFRLLAGRGVGR